ncbi:MAG: hypothetical protein IVW52_04925 [Acidimicrobiales bacterium]|nr:hypothetical protein [Acidimicrobiales bacterium]
MPRHRVHYRFSDYGSVTVEAPSQIEAEAIVEEIDGGLLPTYPDDGDFAIRETEETTTDELTWPDGPPTYAALEAKKAAKGASA